MKAIGKVEHSGTLVLVTDSELARITEMFIAPVSQHLGDSQLAMILRNLPRGTAIRRNAKTGRWTVFEDLTLGRASYGYMSSWDTVDQALKAAIDHCKDAKDVKHTFLNTTNKSQGDADVEADELKRLTDEVNGLRIQLSASQSAMRMWRDCAIKKARQPADEPPLDKFDDPNYSDEGITAEELARRNEIDIRVAMEARAFLGIDTAQPSRAAEPGPGEE